MDLKEKSLLAGAEPNRHPWERARVALLQSWMEQVGLGRGAILDVGCGDAFVLTTIAANWPEHRCIGVDDALPGPSRLEAFDVSLLTSLDQVPSELQVAAILLMDVLEHIEQPERLIAELKSRGLLGPETLVFITVPAGPWLFSSHDQALGHFRRYTTETLQSLTRGSGLVRLAGGNLFFSLWAVRFWQRVGERLRLYRPEFKGLAGWTWPAWATNLVTRTLLLEARLEGAFSRAVGWNLPGLSCYSICRLG